MMPIILILVIGLLLLLNLKGLTQKVSVKVIFQARLGNSIEIRCTMVKSSLKKFLLG
ncbi:hypothetical protein PMO01_28320 [Pseudomonas moraviensis R28-S]|uniref:Uncharacterized protein n=1 Tax=Pseudomonas moraviensis R28-S TaxID=1395516 RepID=V8R0E4_9PSED|nr:hypothetical protein PMO01_28320 [Pseudomonas moraviensis R28-S]